jgi:hypothetical protein
MGKIKERKNQQMLNICAVSSKEYLSLALGLETLREALEVFALCSNHRSCISTAPIEACFGQEHQVLELAKIGPFFFFFVFDGNNLCPLSS